MMRRWPMWLTLFALLCIIALLPMRLAMSVAGVSDSGINARAVSGTIWHGHATDVSLGAMRLGSLDTGLSPTALLLGRARLALSRDAGNADGPLSGAVESGYGLRRIIDLTGSIAGPGDGALPIRTVQFEQFNARFDDDRCTSASGTVRVMLGLSIAGLDLRHGLSGAATCRDGALVLPLAGQSAMEHLTLTIRGDRTYVAQLRVRADDPLLAAALVAAGLSPVQSGFGYRIEGRY